jgi:integrase
MSVRKRQWKNAKGETLESWVVDYFAAGKRCFETFAKKRDADARHAAIKVEIKAGIHTPNSASLTIAEAGELWIKSCDGLERATLRDYGLTLRLHIAPFIGKVKLPELTLPMVVAFEDKLREQGRSPAMVRRARVALSMLLSAAQERGLVSQNVARGRRKRKTSKAEQGHRLKVGVDIPTPDEIRAILTVLKGRWRPLFMTAIFCGLRGSELRGLRWQDVDLASARLSVCQRADRYHTIDKPKSEAGERTIPIPAPVLNALKEWRLACPRGPLGLVFPNRRGKVESHGNIIQRGLKPVMLKAGVVTKDGKAKYTGLHSLRHFFASWCINPKTAGGLELQGKVVQARMGHSTIAMTMDTYGHLFPEKDDSAELAAAASHLFAV